MTSVFCRECGGWMVNSEENLTIWICELCDIEIELDIEEERIFTTGYSVNKMLKEALYDPSELSQAFRTRINEFYLNPAKISSAFAQGVLCFTLIDFLANIIITDVSQVQDYREFIFFF